MVTSSTPRGAVSARYRRGEQGYNLVMLVVAITLLNIAVAVALPLWSYTIRRDREEETIFRGLQYAEAIRVFQQRNGRYPTTLEELVKVEPRSIRQLWNETLTDHGEFGLVVEAPPQPAPGQPGQPGQPPTPGQPVQPPPVAPPGQQPGGNAGGGFGIGGQGRGGSNLVKLPRGTASGKQSGQITLATAGAVAIHGVYLDHRGDSLRSFFGQEKYEEWTFIAEMIQPPLTVPDRPLPRVRSDWLGKAFPDGLSPAMGAGPGGAGSPGQVPQGGGPGAAPDGRRPGAPEQGEDEGDSDDEDDDDQEGANDEDDDEPPLVFPEDFPEDEPPPVHPVDVPLEPEFPEEQPVPEDEPLPAEEPPIEEEIPVDPDLEEQVEEIPESAR